MKKYRIKTYCAVLLCAALCLTVCACGGAPKDHIDLADEFAGQGIATAAQLIRFIEEGEEDTATLLAPIDLENDMLRITADRGPITIEGSGCTITGSGDCVIRLEDGGACTLNNTTIDGGSDAIGCLGDAAVGGNGLTVLAGRNGIVCKGQLAILENSDMTVTAAEGSALYAKGITFTKGAVVRADAGLNAVHTTKNDLTLMAGAELYAYTTLNYNAVKCADTLVMDEGSVFVAENRGEYHGAEVDSLSVTGAVTIRCVGGEKGMGMFVFTQNTDICVLGSCEPEVQYENGSGSITFVESISAYNDFMAKQAEAEAAASQQTGTDTGEEDAG